MTVFARILLCLLGVLSVSISKHAGAQGLDQLTQLRDARNFRWSSGNADWKHSNVDFVPILPGKTLTLADIKGSGSIRRIWMTVLPSEPGYSRLMTLRIYWDGEKDPSVQCPIGDFFGVGHGLDEIVNSIPVRVSAEGRARSCSWIMPFRKSARVTVTNDGSLATWGFYYQVDGEYSKVSADTPYFHAMYRQEFPCRPGNYVVADIKGRGHYVGTVLSTRSTADGWWGEGNDYFFVDGEQTPSLRGTGFEDYFGEAWALRKTNGPYAGCSVFEGGFPGARSTCYRWHIPDPISFRKGLRVEFQHMGVGVGPKGDDRNDVERPDEFSSVGFWYQIEPHAPFPPIPAGPDRMPFDYRHFVDAEDLKIAPPATGKTAVVKINGLHHDKQLEWSGAQDGSELVLPFTVPSTGTYQVMVLVTKRWDGALGRFYIDDKAYGERISFFNPDFTPLQEIALELGSLEAGPHTLRLKCVGKPAEAEPGRWFGVDGFIVQPLRPVPK
ncbi:MAG: DUF2961 domain-containing protein [Fimbriimonas sp.]|nr:DUF2961 domain-containing protein [Fimbriimonas sp.]